MLNTADFLTLLSPGVAGRHPEHTLQLELLPCPLRQEQVPDVNRVERATEDADVHRF
jgi:hypothetical protein